MDIMFAIIGGSISALIGFTIGRLGDKLGGHLNAPHHWIYGLILTIVALILLPGWYKILFSTLGLGHFISDLRDFFHFRLWGIDEPHKWRFWSIK